jgi:outer membrane receptor protein involved in Fe transport
MHDSPALRDGAGAIIYTGFYRDVALLIARYTQTHSATGISLSVFGRNLTNELYEARAYNGGLDIGIGTLTEPRVVGVELKVLLEGDK